MVKRLRYLTSFAIALSLKAMPLAAVEETFSPEDKVQQALNALPAACAKLQRDCLLKDAVRSGTTLIYAGVGNAILSTLKILPSDQNSPSHGKARALLSLGAWGLRGLKYAPPLNKLNKTYDTTKRLVQVVRTDPDVQIQEKATTLQNKLKLYKNTEKYKDKLFYFLQGAHAINLVFYRFQDDSQTQQGKNQQSSITKAVEIFDIAQGLLNLAEIGLEIGTSAYSLYLTQKIKKSAQELQAAYASKLA